jgi:phosphoglycolate phosphatase
LTRRLEAAVRLLAVDLDGTLVDSAPDLAHCLGIALGAVDLPAPSEPETRSWIGDGVEELIRRALADALPGTCPDTFRAADVASNNASIASPDASSAFDLFRTALAAFSSTYAEHLFDRSRLYPHVPETLDTLLERGLRLCCITNKRIAFAAGVLEQSGIADRFELVLGGDSLPLKKPSPVQLEAARRELGVAASAAVLVGDSLARWRHRIRADFGNVAAPPAAEPGQRVVLDDQGAAPLDVIEQALARRQQIRTRIQCAHAGDNGVEARQISRREIGFWAPAIPSTMQWWTFWNSAERPPSRPSMRCISQSGRLRASGCASSVAVSSRSS